MTKNCKESIAFFNQSTEKHSNKNISVKKSEPGIHKELLCKIGFYVVNYVLFLSEKMC